MRIVLKSNCCKLNWYLDDENTIIVMHIFTIYEAISAVIIVNFWLSLKVAWIALLSPHCNNLHNRKSPVKVLFATATEKYEYSVSICWSLFALKQRRLGAAEFTSVMHDSKSPLLHSRVPITRNMYCCFDVQKIAGHIQSRLFREGEFNCCCSWPVAYSLTKSIAQTTKNEQK